MSRKNHIGTIGGAIFGLAMAMSGPLCAQGAAPPPAPALGTSPKSEAALAQAKKDAGTQWNTAYEFLCKADGGTANNANDPVLEPVRLFDDLYALGRTSNVVYVIKTTDGLILTDAGYRDDVETVIVPGIKKLGLDPAQIKYVLVTHGHADHYGGAPFLQQTYGAKVGLSAEDWTTAANAAKPVEGRPPPAAAPRQDLVVVPGQAVTLGNTKVTPVLIPGHTPGALGYIFPVTDGNQKHVAGIFGGTILIHTRIPDEGLKQYSESLKHFGEEAAKLGVDVEIQNHPLYDDMQAKIALLNARKPGDKNPFVVGKEGYQQFLRVMSGCANTQLERRAAAR